MVAEKGQTKKIIISFPRDKVSTSSSLKLFPRDALCISFLQDIFSFPQDTISFPQDIGSS